MGGDAVVEAMKLSHEDLDDLIEAMRLGLEFGIGVRSDEEIERWRQLLIRLRVRKMTTKDGE